MIGFASADRVWEMIYGRRQPNLALLSAVTMNLQGLANAVIYGLTESVTWEWKKFIYGSDRYQTHEDDDPYCFLAGSDITDPSAPSYNGTRDRLDTKDAIGFETLTNVS